MFGILGMIVLVVFLVGWGIVKKRDKSIYLKRGKKDWEK